MPTPPRHQHQAWWDIMAYLDDRCDPVTHSYQVPIETFAAAVGLHQRSLFRYLDEMKQLNVLAVRRIATDFVAGRQPNVYTLLIRPAELRDRWAEITGPPEPLDLSAPAHVQPTPIEDEISQDVLDALEDLDTAEGQVDAWLAQ